MINGAQFRTGLTYPQPYCDNALMAVRPVAPSVRLKSRPPSSFAGHWRRVLVLSRSPSPTARCLHPTRPRPRPCPCSFRYQLLPLTKHGFYSEYTTCVVRFTVPRYLFPWEGEAPSPSICNVVVHAVHLAGCNRVSDCELLDRRRCHSAYPPTPAGQRVPSEHCGIVRFMKASRTTSTVLHIHRPKRRHPAITTGNDSRNQRIASRVLCVACAT
jgi:hypothetical protein